MYRMMVVDDLPYIVDRMERLIGEQEQLKLEMYKAYSAFEALDTLKRIKIDIVLTDIKMPGMEGIELLHEIRKYWPRCKVIFLTSYDEFHYAKSAISGGGFDFILKFEQDEAIINAIHRAVAALNDEYAAMKQLHEAQMQKRQMIPLLQEQYLHNMLYGKADIRNTNEQFRELGIPLRSELPMYVLVGKVDDWASITDTSERKLLLYAARNVIEELLNVSVILVSATVEQSKLVCLLQPKEILTAEREQQPDQEIWARTFIFVFETVMTIQATCRDLFKLSFSFALGEEPVPAGRLTELFDRLLSLFLSRLGAGKELRLTDRMLADLDNPSAAAAAQYKLQGFVIKKIELLGRYLKSGAKAEFDQLFAEIMTDMIRHSDSGFLKLEVHHNLASVFLSYLRLHPPTPSLLAQVNVDKLTKANPDLSWEEMKLIFASMSERIFESNAAEAKDEGKENLIHWLNDYIEQHISEELSLTRLAEVVHLNPVYLSRLYMQATGVGISDYVNMCRLNRSKELLKSSHHKIYEIAGMVGYDSALSFIRFFKKQMNMTPQEYRNL